MWTLYVIYHGFINSVHPKYYNNVFSANILSLVWPPVFIIINVAREFIEQFMKSPHSILCHSHLTLWNKYNTSPTCYKGVNSYPVFTTSPIHPPNPIKGAHLNMFECLQHKAGWMGLFRENTLLGLG